MSASRQAADQIAIAREHLRNQYRPASVRLLFVGEAPPASGRFFYQADSGLYRAIRDTFVKTFPSLEGANFLESFRNLGCYLVDLCETPVDRLPYKERKNACADSESRLGELLTQLRPQVIVALVLSIVPNVERVQRLANWTGTHLALPYPGRWHHHREAFAATLSPLLLAKLKDNPTEESQAPSPPFH